ncbi:sigma-70 family RNA polymerase sigma factor [Streptosporangium sp. KLBMP 9127]|nr:sigma-70 family RNA polymerase sigma factor [Streptosporangium sp. KLBMP 9127]
MSAPDPWPPHRDILTDPDAPALPPATPSEPSTAPAVLVREAADGDHSAWCLLVERFGPAMWATARSYGLSGADADDAVQAAWLRLVESLHAIRDPRGIGGWLVTTTRRETLRLARERRDVQPSHEPADLIPDPACEDAATAVLDADRGNRLWLAVESMEEPCRTLLRLIATAPESGTHQLAVRLGMPRGSVGPTRGRCLRRLRTLVSAEETLH